MRYGGGAAAAGAGPQRRGGGGRRGPAHGAYGDVGRVGARRECPGPCCCNRCGLLPERDTGSSHGSGCVGAGLYLVPCRVRFCVPCCVPVQVREAQLATLDELCGSLGAAAATPLLQRLCRTANAAQDRPGGVGSAAGGSGGGSKAAADAALMALSLAAVAVRHLPADKGLAAAALAGRLAQHADIRVREVGTEDGGWLPKGCICG